MATNQAFIEKVNHTLALFSQGNFTSELSFTQTEEKNNADTLRLLEDVRFYMKEKEEFTQDILDARVHTRLRPKSNKDILGKNLQQLQKEIVWADDILTQVADGNLDVDLSSESTFLVKPLTRVVDSLTETVEQIKLLRVGSFNHKIKPKNNKDLIGYTLSDLADVLQSISLVAEKVSTGDTSEKIKIKGEDDLLGKSINKIVDTLDDVANQADLISTGNYQSDIQPKSQKDKLGIALQRMVETIRNVALVADKISTGDTSEKVNVQGSNDLLAQSINKIVDTLNDAADQADIIASGNFEADIKPRSDKDKLGIALQKMTKNLRDISQVSERIAEGDLNTQVDVQGKTDLLALSINKMVKNIHRITLENEKQLWFTKSQSELSECMRGDLETEVLAENILNYVAQRTNSQMGVFYIHENDKLTLLTSYAFMRRKNLSNEYRIGEGLVGQAAYERSTILLENIPDDYFKITSGLGETKPRNILIVPILFEGKLQAVIELGSFYEYTDEMVTFIEESSESVIISMNASKSRDEMAKLLETSREQAAKLEQQTQELQAQTEELQSQQEELRISNETMEEQTQELKKNEENLRAQQEELQQINEELEEKTNSLEEQQNEVKKQNEYLQRAHIDLDQKAKELELTSKYKSEFLANMSHELRTPLNSMLILAQILAENKDGNLDEKKQDFAQTIFQSGNDLLSLINEILDLSKIEAGKMDLVVEPIVIDDVTSYLLRSFSPTAEQNGIYFKIDNQYSYTHLHTDRQRLEQVLRNLISNATKFTEKGGITLSVHEPSANLDIGVAPNNCIAFSVKDTGIGIPRDKQLLIFEAFQQVDGSTSRRYGGTGLGLSISRELAKLLGGRIFLESEEGVGSTFSLVLPLELKREELPEKNNTHIPEPPVVKVPVHVPKPKPIQKDDREGLRPDEKTLLVIEDDSKFSKIVMDLAREKGFQVIVAEDGERGVLLAEEHLPSSIILDLGLPKIDGLSVLKLLKENLNTRHIPVFVISAEEKQQVVLQMGAVGYLTKPVTLQTLSDVFTKFKEYSGTTPKNILIVEDDKSTIKSMKEYIDVGTQNVKIDTAEEGKIAIDKVSTGNYDCVILDLKLPDMSGFDVLEYIKNINLAHIPPVIIYTGKELTKREETKIRKYTDHIIIKGTKSIERLLDEITLFLHTVVEEMSKDKQDVLKMIHNRDEMFEGKEVLIVDDDVRNLYALSNVLESYKMKVTQATNGVEALEALKEMSHVDLVLMDIMMPEMDGYQATREIRKNRKYNSLPIIALTAKAMKEDRQLCIDAGANDYMSKPLDKEKLISLLRVWLHSRTKKVNETV